MDHASQSGSRPWKALGAAIWVAAFLGVTHDARADALEAKCAAAQMQATGKLCSSILRCAAKGQSDPSELEACEAKATSKFSKVWKRHQDRYLAHCPSQASAESAATELETYVGPIALAFARSMSGPDQDRKVGSALSKIVGKTCDNVFKIEAKHARKVDPEALVAARFKVFEKLQAKVVKILDSAERRGSSVPAVTPHGLAHAVAGVVDDRIAAICPNPPCLRVASIWSEQFPGVSANRYPGGAGSSGNRVGRILMSVRDDSRAYVGAQVEIIPPAPLDGLGIHVGLALDPTAPEPDLLTAARSGPDGRVSLDFLPQDDDLVPDEYYVIAWIDHVENGRIDRAEDWLVAPGRFAIVDQNQFSSWFLNLEAKIRLGGLFGVTPPRATALAKAFLLAESIDLGGIYPSSPIALSAIEPSLQASLAYRVGFTPTSSNDGTLRNFFLPGDSSLSEDIRRSLPFQLLIDQALKELRSEVRDEWPERTEFRYRLPGRISYPGDDPSQELESDLHFAFNEASLDADLILSPSCREGRLRAEELRVEGALVDLYDFDYAPSPLTEGHRMAIVQAGFGALDDLGSIYRIEVDLGSDLEGYEVDLGPCSESPGAGCGNGELDPGEECDDGNTASGDGCSASCRVESISRCEVVVGPSHPGALRIQNLANDDVLVLFKDFALGAVMRPGACEIFGWPTGFWEAEVQRYPDGEIAEAFYSIDEERAGFSWNFESCFTMVLRASCTPDVEPPFVCCQEVP